MTYYPHSEDDIKSMLKALGKEKLEDLTDAIPEQNRCHPIELPKGIDEMTVASHFNAVGEKNRPYRSIFLGAGAYNHYIPAVIDELAGRQEFYTAYTPYQAEISQGTLRAIFEYQTYITELTGMDVANASMYDGATALAEAVIMSVNHNRKKKVLVDSNLHPEYLKVLETYMEPIGIEIDFYNSHLFKFDSVGFEEVWNGEYTAYVVASPNYKGSIIDFSPAADIVHGTKGALIHVVSEILSLALLKSPGEMGADIVCGEAQSLGIPLSYGGPYLGFLSCKKLFMRKMPGRIVGQSADKAGNVAYTLTLSTREQHIRRENATSNICSNHGLCALRASIYLSLLGASGLRSCALKNVENAHYLQEKIGKIEGFKVFAEQSFFNEFIVKCGKPYELIKERLESADILSFLPVSGMDNHYLVCATEMNSKEEMDRFADLLGSL